MKKIKVLQVIGNMNRGGAETFLMNVFRNIDREKFDFYFLCYKADKCDYKDEILELGGKIITIDQPSKRRFVKNIKDIEKVIKENDIDIVHAHTYYNSCYAIYAAHKCGVNARIAHSHSTKSEATTNFLKEIYYKISKRIINKYANAKFACGELAGRSIYDSQFEIIENGIDVEYFSYNEQARKEKRKELKISEDSKVIGHVGRFEPVKNQSFLIDIFKEYLKIKPDSVLLLIGEGRLKGDNEKKVKELKLEDKIKFLGMRTDMSELYSTMDVFVMPSLFEGLPVTLVETQTNMLPALVSENVSEECKMTNKIEFFSLNKSAKEWAAKIDELLNCERNNYKAEESLKKYDMKKNVKKIEERYIEMISC